MGRGGRAFTRLDLTVLTGVLFFLSLWFGLGRAGETGRIARCAANLAGLGRAMQGFENDHGSALPPASIDPQRLAWDSQIMPYLSHDSYGDDPGTPFGCPSDRRVRSRPRSYAMSAHDMQWENWPPGPDNATGVGLVWTKETLQRLLGDDAVKTAATNTEVLAMVKQSAIVAPASTVVLTELFKAGNNLKDTKMAAVSGPGEQLEQFMTSNAPIHFRRCNYLMLDGHVELLSPLQAGTAPGVRNLWNISKQD